MRRFLMLCCLVILPHPATGAEESERSAHMPAEAEKLMRQERWTAAIRLLLESPRPEPKSEAAVYRMLGQALEQVKPRPDDLEAWNLTAELQDPEGDARARFVLGAAAYRLGVQRPESERSALFAAALAHLERARSFSEPAAVKADLLEALIRYRMRDRQGAEEALTRAEPFRSDDPDFDWVASEIRFATDSERTRYRRYQAFLSRDPHRYTDQGYRAPWRREAMAARAHCDYMKNTGNCLGVMAPDPMTPLDEQIRSRPRTWTAHHSRASVGLLATGLLLLPGRRRRQRSPNEPRSGTTSP